MLPQLTWWPHFEDTMLVVCSFGTFMNLLHLSVPSALLFLQWSSSLYCEALQMILQQDGV